MSVGLETEAIIEVLNRLSKVPVPESIVNFIRECTLSYGKVKLVLKHNKYYIESSYPEVLQTLLKDPTIRDARVLPGLTENETGSGNGLLISKAPQRGNLVISGSKAAEQPTPAPKSDDLFASVVGVGSGKLRRHTSLHIAFTLS